MRKKNIVLISMLLLMFISSMQSIHNDASAEYERNTQECTEESN